MTSTAARRRHRYNSDHDSLKLLDFESTAETGSVPYDDYYDYGPNSIQHLIECLELVDNNFFEEETCDFFDVYKL